MGGLHPGLPQPAGPSGHAQARAGSPLSNAGVGRSPPVVLSAPVPSDPALLSRHARAARWTPGPTSPGKDEPPMFSPETTALVARARQHALGDLLHRTARRYPDKLAVVAGDRRVTYAEFDAAVNRAANALADRGLAKGDRLALLSPQLVAVRRARLRHGAARRRPGAGQLHARPRRDRLHPPALRRERDGHRGRAGAHRGEGARHGRRRGRRPRLDRRCPAPRPTAGWEDVDDWWQSGDEAARTSPSPTTTRCG